LFPISIEDKKLDIDRYRLCRRKRSRGFANRFLKGSELGRCEPAIALLIEGIGQGIKTLEF
jgi:hypothetical protein